MQSKVKRTRGIACVLVLLWAIFVCAGSALSQDAQKPAPWYESVSTNVFISTAYSYNFNNPDLAKNNFHVFDFDENSLKVDVIDLAVRKDATKAGETGFRFDLTAGSSIPRATRSSGLDIGDLDFLQLYASYIAPLGRGVRFDVGKFITPAGYEYIENCDGHNDNYTHSFLFAYALPSTHTGVKVSDSFAENVSAALMLVNGWDNAIDNNKSKTIVGQVGVAPVSRTNLTLVYMFGPEKLNNNSDNRSLLDVFASDTLSDLLTLGINFDLGSEEHSVANGATAHWNGIAGYARLNLSGQFAVALRGEQFSDENGVRTGVSQKLQEFTITPEIHPADNFILRADFRFDHSDKAVFQKEGGWVDTQATIGINALFTF